jgi:hemoglobin
MKTEINGRAEIELLINAFYERVKTDPVIGHFFGHVHWDKHLPVMYDFWENALFYTGGYTGNPLKIHQAFHQRHPLSEADFKQWITLFTDTLDSLFEGEKAELARQRAYSISTVMQLKTVYKDAASNEPV